MQNQIVLAQQAERLGFAALWARNVPLNDPSFGDLGQIYDPFVWLPTISAHTSNIALATGAIILPSITRLMSPRRLRDSIDFPADYGAVSPPNTLQYRANSLHVYTVSPPCGLTHQPTRHLLAATRRDRPRSLRSLQPRVRRLPGS